MTHSYIFAGKQLLADLGIAPVYLIDATATGVALNFTEAERQLLLSGDNIAFTNPALDAMLSGRRLLYEWKGRGFACIFEKSPLTMTKSQFLGVLLHEAGHWVAACNKPYRDDPNIKAAIAASFQDKYDPHDHRWLRATVHLWHRATAVLGHEINLADVRCLDGYGFGRKELGPLLEEASNREGECVQEILSGRTNRTTMATTATSQRVESGAEKSKRLRAFIRDWRKSPSGYHTQEGVFIEDCHDGTFRVEGIEVPEAKYRQFEARVFGSPAWKAEQRKKRQPAGV